MCVVASQSSIRASLRAYRRDVGHVHNHHDRCNDEYGRADHGRLWRGIQDGEPDVTPQLLKRRFAALVPIRLPRRRPTAWPRRKRHFDEGIASRRCRIDFGCYRHAMLVHNRPDVRPKYNQGEFPACEILLVPDVLVRGTITSNAAISAAFKRSPFSSCGGQFISTTVRTSCPARKPRTPTEHSCQTRCATRWLLA